jgi:hypothetical protein
LSLRKTKKEKDKYITSLHDDDDDDGA